MKEIMAIVRMNMVNHTKKALLEAGYPSITVRKVMGRGKKKIDFSLAEGSITPEMLSSTPFAEQVSEGHRLIPKRIFTMIVKDNDVKKIVDIIIKVNSTGNPGDGKIFVLPISEAYTIRTGDNGESAL